MLYTVKYIVFPSCLQAQQALKDTVLVRQGRSVGQIVWGGHQHRRPIKPEANMAKQNLTV